MAKFKIRKNRGFSLIEVLIAASIGIFLISAVLSMWFFAYRNWSSEQIETRLRLDVEISSERFKEEMRLSSLTYASFYPPAAIDEYTAISFPAVKPDAVTGFLPKDAEWNIVWDERIVYHVYNGELRRTVFTDNNLILTDADDRDDQLEDLVLYVDIHR